MKKYQYDISIEASGENEADTKMQALVILAQKLSAKELARLAHIVKHDPVKTALAKKYLGV
ncbi:MAG TPA: hypothetical protein PKA77_14150 [Chitinophagaceae bacterium]|jgi:hypothetical protein|nr:hypothetical protein [Chitinophagaceae bacterium]HMU58632.1 hypothetical protein [Chitinophagaceae bacterium]